MLHIENNHSLSTDDQAAINELKQVIQDLQTKYPTAEPARQSAIIEVEFEEIKQKQEWRRKKSPSQKEASIYLKKTSGAKC